MLSALLATALLLLAALGYAVRCWLSPFGNCRRCDGWGVRARTDRHGRPKRGKPCRRCRTSGKRLRIGRRLHNRARAIRDAGAR